MNTPALVQAMKKNHKKGLLLVAETLGRLLGDEPLQDLAKAITGIVPKDQRTKGIRDALLEVLASAEATRINQVSMQRPVLVNHYDPKFAKIWLEFDCDLGIVPVSDDHIGEEPVWLDDEVSMVGWESILDVDLDMMAWMLKNGIVPHQPFLVSLKPHWYRAWSDYGYEYDVDFNASIDYVEPRTPGEVAEALDRYLEVKVCHDCER